MEIHEFYIPSSSGIANLHCMEWIPSGEVKAIVQIAHGMMEHVGRYREFAEFLAGHGIYVLGNDHLGHGKTAAAAEDRGYFGEHGGAVSVIRDKISRCADLPSGTQHGIIFRETISDCL